MEEKAMAKFYVISIHAPARGASSIASICFDSPLFQFTPLREGLHYLALMIMLAMYFNSRPCERGFNSHFKVLLGAVYFNSRPCERGFLERQLRTGTQKNISIHAPARGASFYR